MLSKQCFIHIYQLHGRNKNLVYVWSGSQIWKYIFKLSMKTNIWQLGQKQYTGGSLLSTFLSAAEQSRPWGCIELHRFNCFAPSSVCVCVCVCVLVHTGVCCCQPSASEEISSKAHCHHVPCGSSFSNIPLSLIFLHSCIKLERRCMLLITIVFLYVITCAFLLILR